MRTFFYLFVVLALPFSSTAIDLPENPPDDFFISYEVRGITEHEATHVTDFMFTASASGNATLETEKGGKITFDIGANSVKKLYKAVRESDFFGYWQPSKSGKERIYELSVVADGNEKSFHLTNNENITNWELEAVIIEILDEKRPGWRD